MGRVDIATNQIELSPYLKNRQLPAFLQQNILAASCMSLAYGKLRQDPVLIEIAAKQQATVV